MQVTHPPLEVDLLLVKASEVLAHVVLGEQPLERGHARIVDRVHRLGRSLGGEVRGFVRASNVPARREGGETAAEPAALGRLDGGEILASSGGPLHHTDVERAAGRPEVNVGELGGADVGLAGGRRSVTVGGVG